MTAHESLLMELGIVAGDIKELIDYHKKRLVEEGYDPVKAMTMQGEPYFAQLFLARATALSAIAILLKR